MANHFVMLRSETNFPASPLIVILQMVSFNLGATYLFSVIRDSMSTSVYGNNVKIFWGLEKLFHSFTFLKMSTQQMSKWLLCCIHCRNSSYKIISQLSKQRKKCRDFFKDFYQSDLML